MEEFIQLFGNLLVLVYHCFDRIVIHGYLSGLSRPEQVVYFFRQVLGIPGGEQRSAQPSAPTITGTGSKPTPATSTSPSNGPKRECAKRIYVLPALRRMEKAKCFGVYFIFKSMEQGRTFRITVPKYPTQDPNYRILAHQRSRFTHYYFYIRDEVLGPIIVRVASFFPFHATYWLNGSLFHRAGTAARRSWLPQE